MTATERPAAERPADGVVALYERHGARWAALRGEAMPERGWLDRFCDLLPAHAELLDVGCGAGVPLARALVRRGHAVTGVDAAATMLALFRRNLPGSPTIHADMRALALGRRFAGLLAWDSLFHLPAADQRDMFARLAAHALPGAPLLFTSGPAAGVAIGELEGEPLHHASLDPADYRALLDSAGFDVVAHVAEDPACGRHTVWLARRHRCNPAPVATVRWERTTALPPDEELPMPAATPAETLAYKVLLADEMAALERDGSFAGAPVDLADGYVHLSTAAQVDETVRRHFAGREDLHLAAVDLSALGDALRWEPSRGGQLFPHLYAPLALDTVVAYGPLERDDAGRVRLPVAG